MGSRMELPYTRAMINAALNGQLNHVEYHQDEVFKLRMPKSCPGVPSELLNPIDTWDDKDAYRQKANELATYFNNNFKKYEGGASDAILQAAPQPSAEVNA